MLLFGVTSLESKIQFKIKEASEKY
jgi:hypothetical protein